MIIIAIIKLVTGYKTLYEIANVKEGELYTKGEYASDYPLTLVYGDEDKAPQEKFAFRTEKSYYYFYNKRGEEVLKITFADDRKYNHIVDINGTKYLYKKIGSNEVIDLSDNYDKKQTPSRYNSKSEKMMADITSTLEENDCFYKWENNVVFYVSESPSKYSYASTLTTRKIVFKIMEYNTDSIDEDYNLLCDTIRATKEESNEFENSVINKFIDNNTDLINYTIIKNDNIIYYIEYNETALDSYSYGNEDIEIIERYLKERNILN